ncbi:MAG: glycosyl hydrolase, partial [Bacteroidia bacterium]|nr:glycosyl hydrolase [Bacteroidia bacterium]
MKRRTPFIPLLAFALLGCLLSTQCTQKPTDPLKAGFLNPPDSARPGVYWYFMDGNTTREAMTGDLESMKKAGIGYVLFLEVNVGVPRGKVDFLSEEWQDLYVHAVREAERLGIRIILGSGPGWAGSGGPWVKPEQSMMHLVASSTEVKGPSVFNAVLPKPEPKKPFFGEGALTKELKQIRDGWYEDVVVLAYPTPDTRYLIPDTDEKALYYRAPYTSQQGVKQYIPAPAAYPEIPGSAIDAAKIIELTNLLQPDGTLKWEVPPGKWTILRFGKRNNGAVTRPAPMPGLGFEVDKFDTVAFDAHFDAYIGKLLRKVGPRKSKTGGGWTMIHIDSWEMGSQNWTGDFREQFKKRRGYDPLLYLPTYAGQTVGSLELSERFLWDVRLTSQELVLENHAGRFKELGRRNGFRLSIEPYDMNPTADLDLGAVADVPMCEFWTDKFGFNSAFSTIESTSIAHVQGKPVVAAEAFT